MAVEPNETRLATRYEAIRRREYEVINEFLNLLPRIDAVEEGRVSQVRDALFHADHPFLMVFVGPFSSGKSSIINALLGRPDVLPIGPIPTTDRISILRWGDEFQRMNSGGEVNTVFYPSELLKKVSFVDTPGLESIFQKHEDITRKFLHRSDVVFMVMLATQAMTSQNLDYLRQLRDYGKKVIIVINQADLIDDNDADTVREYVQDQARDVLGSKPDVWLVSAKEGMEARTGKNLPVSTEAKPVEEPAEEVDSQPETEDESTAGSQATTTTIDPEQGIQAKQPVEEEEEAEAEAADEAEESEPQLTDKEAVREGDLWRSSGMHQFEEYIDDQLDDVQRMRQKLQTPLQIIQNAHYVALEAVKSNQTVLDQYQGIADNVQQQLDSYKREQNKIVRDLNEEVEQKFTEAGERGEQAIVEVFKLSNAFGSVMGGLGDLTGIGRLLRGGRKSNRTRLAFERHKVYEPINQLPDVSDRIGPRLEGKDLQDIDDLVKYTQNEIKELPPTIQGKVIGNITPPSQYDRSVLKGLRDKLETIEERAKSDETENMETGLRNVLFGLAVWELLVILSLIFMLIAGVLDFSQPIAFGIVLLMIFLGMVGVVFLPLAGRFLGTRYKNQMAKLQSEYIETLTRAADEQIEYGMRLRREVVAPLTRLVEAQTQIQTEQMNKLQELEQEMVSIESELTKMGKRNILGMRG